MATNIESRALSSGGRSLKQWMRIATASVTRSFSPLAGISRSDRPLTTQYPCGLHPADVRPSASGERGFARSSQRFLCLSRSQREGTDARRL